MQRWAWQPLLGTAGARRRASRVLAWCVIVVGAGAVLFAGQASADSLDRAMDDSVTGWLGGHRALLHWMQYPGTQVPALAVSAVLVAWCLLAGRLSGAILVALADLIATGCADWLLKPLVDRTYLGALSYPSGHASSVAALTATVAVLLLAPPRPARSSAAGSSAAESGAVRTGAVRAWLARVAALAAVALGIAVTCLVVLAVIALRWHYCTDAVAGAAFGVGTVCALALLLDLASRRGSRSRGQRQS